MQKFSYKLASFDRRVAAKLLDLGVCFFISIAGEAIIRALGAHPAWAVLPLLLAIAYWLLGDSMKGQSFGKRLLGLKVIDYRHGYTCTPGQSLIRNFAGLSWVRLWQIAEEEGAIEAGTFTGQIVIDVRNPKPKDTGSTAQSDSTSSPSRPNASIDFEGIGTLLQDMRKKDD